MPELLAWASRWPFIADPWFYAVAVPAVLLMGLGKSGFLSGFGALATPLLALVVPVPQAAAIMLPLLLVMDVTGLQQLWRERDRELLRLAAAGRAAGRGHRHAAVRRAVGARPWPALVGALTLLFLAQRLLFPPTADSPPPPRWVGFGLATASGFTSFVVHAGSPPLNAYLLPLRLKPIAFAGTAAVFFAVVNLAKWLPYAWLGLIDRSNLAHLGAAAAAGAAGRVAGRVAGAAHRAALVLSRWPTPACSPPAPSCCGTACAERHKKSPRPDVAAGSLAGHRPGLAGAATASWRWVTGSPGLHPSAQSCGRFCASMPQCRCTPMTH